MPLRGLFRLLYLYDVAESIDLGKLRGLLGARGESAEHVFPRRTPGYVRFEQPPIIEPAEFITVCAGVSAACRGKYYNFGAIVVQVELPFECDWPELVTLGSRWMDAPDVEPCVRDLARRRMEQIGPAVTKPTEDWVQENYLVVEIHEVHDAEGKQSSADELMASYGSEMVQLIRGETAPLAQKSIDETLQS